MDKVQQTRTRIKNNKEAKKHEKGFKKRGYLKTQKSDEKAVKSQKKRQK